MCPSFSLYETPAKRLSQLKQVHSSLEEEPEAVREEFNRFLMSVVGRMAERQQQEEGYILNDGDTDF